MQSTFRAALAIVLLAFLAVPGAALADDWVAIKLRGAVMQHVGGEWIQLRRGDIVPDDRVVQTLKHARVTFKRDKETIELAPETQVQIVDRSGKRYTTVKQAFGSVTIEAEVRNVQHFEVQTPHLAAVVKGTKFVVTSGESGGLVKVTRGLVAVEDEHNGQSVTVAAGQTVVTEDGQSMEVSGRGKLPVVVDAGGSPVIATSASNGQGNGGANSGNALNAIGNGVGNTVGDVGSAVGDAVGGSVGSAVGNASGAVGNTVSDTVSGVTGILGGLL